MELLKFAQPGITFTATQKGGVMKTKAIVLLLSSLVFLYACAAFQAGSDVAAGWRALLGGNNETALSYFQSAAQLDPNYRYGTAYQQGILGYVGSTEYSLGDLQRAMANGWPSAWKKKGIRRATRKCVTETVIAKATITQSEVFAE